MAQETIRVSTIEAVSPTLAETLRECKLRAGLSRADGSANHVLGNPKAWLGTAYHAVLERVGSKHQDDIEGSVRDVWNATIEAQNETARRHRFDKRFGRPESWPGYHMVAAMALVRAKEVMATAAGPSDAAGNRQPGGATRREKRFASSDDKIVGRPDVVRLEEVVDFKTGDVFEVEDKEQIKAAYIRQLCLYAFLVKETLGWWPRRGILLPMAGAPVMVELKAEECEAEAAEAVRLLDEYNEIVGLSPDPIDLANPSPASCRWCPYQLYCPAFWSTVDPDWESELGLAAVEGITLEPPSPIHAATAFTILLQSERGTQPVGVRVSVFPLLGSVHSDIETVQQGDRLRMTGLWRRTDGSIVPSIRTIVADEARLPRLSVSP